MNESLIMIIFFSAVLILSIMYAIFKATLASMNKKNILAISMAIEKIVHEEAFNDKEIQYIIDRINLELLGTDTEYILSNYNGEKFMAITKRTIYLT